MNDMRKIILTLIAFVIAAILTIGTVRYFTAKSSFQGEIISHQWLREWDVERYQFVGGKCWFVNCEPDRAYNVSWRDEVYDYDTVCTGFGDDKKCHSVADYETRVYYTINDWRLGRIMKSDGIETDNVFWPNLNLNQCDNSLVPGVGVDDALLNCERSAKQREWFYINVQATNQDVNLGHCQINYARWTDTVIGLKISGEYWYHQNLIDCNSLVYN